ncbi:MAG: crosslink repair DNA glycosylase YcaQ family protein [Hyphomicrobiales bacterium]
MTRSLSQDEARRAALAAQGFAGRKRPAKPGWADIARTINRLHLLQIDSVNVVVRSHYLPLFARLGSYDRALLDDRSFGTGQRELFECWAHEASFVPLALHPLTRWRHARARAGDGIYSGMDTFAREEAGYLKSVIKHIEAKGPTRARDLPDGGKGSGGWWGWSRGKLALETLFDHGHVTAAARDGFERIYDLPERVLPQDVLQAETPPEREAFRRLTIMAAEALGVATATDLRDYFRLPVAGAKQALEDAVADGAILPVAVKGWKPQAFMHRDAAIPAKDHGTALLSPFDPLVWERARAERLFNFHYRIELYTPEHKRKYGYYVLPFLCSGRLAGRVCLKSDREAGVLKVNTAHIEKEAVAEEVAPHLASELHLMATWLGLSSVAVARKGNLAALLRKAVAA